MKSRYHLFVILAIITIALVLMSGCISNKDKVYIEEDNNFIDSSVNEEAQAEEPLTLNELKDLLETSKSIEVKDIDNQIIGTLNTGKNINEVISDIFYHNVVEDYEYSSDENVIAIISFHIPSADPIYGLIKEKFIYIEGYYFPAQNNSIKNIVNYFINNNEEEPIV